MRAARKCGPTRGMRSTRFSSVRSRRQLRNPRQNSLKLQVSFMPSVVPEGIFIQVVLQILRAHIVVHAADSPLDQTPESLNRLSVNVAGDIDAARVTDATMQVPMRLKAIVGNVLVSENGARRKDIFLRQTMKSFAPCIRCNASNDPAMMSRSAALYHSDDCNLVATVGWPSLSALPMPLAAVVHFIHLHRRTLQLHSIFGEQRTNLAEHAPRGLVGDASFPLNLLCGDAAAGGTHEIHRVEPSLERSSGLLEHGPGQRVDVVPAGLA